MSTYRDKLIKFIEPVPTDGSKIESGTPKWIHEQMRYTEAQVAGLEKGAFFENPVFTTLTGRAHRDLLSQWVSNKTTTCNEFVSRCADAMGWTGTGLKTEGGKALASALGAFDIADRLERWGMADCWVPATPGNNPGFGDLFKALGPVPAKGLRLNHMGVALDYDPIARRLNTVESGQGGSSVGFDGIARKTRSWPDPEIVGWVDIAKVLAARKPMDYWMGGWWIVEEDWYGPSYYYFAAGDQVHYTTRRPATVMAPPDASAVSGTFFRKPGHRRDLMIKWQSDDVDETWQIAHDSGDKRDWTMVGTNARGFKLKAKRWVLADKDDPNKDAGKLPSQYARA